SGARDVNVTLAALDERWSTTTHLAAGTVGEADLVLPSSHAESVLAGGPPPRLEVREGKEALASANIVEADQLRPQDVYIRRVFPPPATISGCIVVGQPRNSPVGWSRMSPRAMGVLGRHRECLDYTAVIAAPNLKWLSLSGINAWVRAGGLLITPGSPRWTPLGDGAVVTAPPSRILDSGFVDRMLLTTHSNLSLYKDTSSRYADHPPDFGSGPDPGAFLQSDVPTGALVVLLGLYLLLLLPGSYFLLRKMRRKEMAWVTAPALALAFSAGIAALCFALKGGSAVVGRVSVIEETSPGVYQSNDYVSIFSPRNMTGSLILPAGSLPDSPPIDYSIPRWQWERNEIHVLATPQATFVDDLSLSQWTARSIAYSSTPPIRGAITATIYGRNGGWTASIQNNSSLDLEGCRAWTGGGWRMIGDLNAGQAKVVSGSLRKPFVDGNAPRGRSFGDRVRQDELAWLLTHTDRERLFFEGWTRQPLQTATVRSVRRYLDESVIVAPLTIVRGVDGLAAPRDVASVASLTNLNANGYPGIGYTGYPGQAQPQARKWSDDNGLMSISLPDQIRPSLDTLRFAAGKWNDQSTSSRQDQVRCSVWNAAARRWDLALRVDAHGRVRQKSFPLADYVTKPPGAVEAHPMIYLNLTGSGAYFYPKIESLSPASEQVVVVLGGN
ncbi:MAG TPA: hypothetical protein VFJ58_15515, partial [Armatimonadota bacterium]|nr:hypothetical protein [Armatimonadota bacterium]